MDINDLTIGQIKAIKTLNINEDNAHPYVIGEKYFIRTVTMYFTGQLEAAYQQELALSQVAWIASTGRFTDAIQTGSFSEVEPYSNVDRVIIGRGTIIDAHIIKFILPMTQK